MRLLKALPTRARAGLVVLSSRNSDCEPKNEGRRAIYIVRRAGRQYLDVNCHGQTPRAALT